MDSYDDELQRFEAHGAVPRPVTGHEDYLDDDGARIWYATAVSSCAESWPPDSALGRWRWDWLRGPRGSI
jgi:hypothetical protein